MAQAHVAKAADQHDQRQDRSEHKGGAAETVQNMVAGDRSGTQA